MVKITKIFKKQDDSKTKDKRICMCNLAPPRVYGFVREQVEIARANVSGKGSHSKRVLIIGASTGYGLSSRITAAFSLGQILLASILSVHPRRKTSQCRLLQFIGI